MELIGIEILNWEDYNPRKDYKKPWWFAMSNRFLEDPQFYDFSADEKLAWIYILSQASLKRSPTISLNIRHAHRACGLSPKILKSAISKLNLIGCTIPVREPNEICTESGRHITEQNNTKQEQVSHASAFELFYRAYPRKEKRTEASKRFSTILKTGVDPEQVMRGLSNYLAHLTKNKVDSKFYKLPTTFLGEYQDWLDPEAGKVVATLAARNYSEMASEVWRWLDDSQVPLPAAIWDLVKQIGPDKLRELHRDDFRPGGLVPGLLKQVQENQGVA